jgi:hypothetical protein
MTRCMRTRCLALVALLLLVACGDDRPLTNDGLGRVMAAVSTGGSPHDVTQIAFALVTAAGACSDSPVTSTMIPVDGSGAQGLMVVAAGSYLVCATPLTAAGTPSAICAAAQASVTVMAGATTEVALVSQCNGAGGNGGLQGTISFNDPPQITGITLGTSTSVTTCQPVAIGAQASDPDGDPLTYAWTVTSGAGAASITGAGADAMLAAGVAGVYQIEVTVTDPAGAATSLTFPVDVADGAPCP